MRAPKTDLFLPDAARDGRALRLSNRRWKQPLESVVSETKKSPDPVKLEPLEFASIYEEHSRSVYYLSLRLLGDPTQAEDATHDVFLKVYRKLGQFRGDAGLRTWLYRITINHCHNLLQTWHHRHLHSNADEADLGERGRPNGYAAPRPGDERIGPAHSKDARYLAGGISTSLVAGGG